MNRRPVGRQVERADAQGEELGPGVHLVVRGSPALWNIVGHIKSDEETGRKRKTKLECEGSTKSQPPGGWKMAGKAGTWKMWENKGKLEGNKPQKEEIAKEAPKRSFNRVKVFETR